MSEPNDTSSPPPEPQRGAPLALLAGGLLVLSAAATLIAQAVQWTSVPEDSDWERAAAAAKATLDAPDTAFMVEPEWDSRPRTWLQPYTYAPAQRPTWTDLAPYTRLAILAESGREDRALARLPGPWREVERTAFGSVSLIVLDSPADDPTRWDALGALKDATVWRTYGAKREDCTRYVPGDWPAWHCKRRDPFLYVGEALRTVTNDTHRCLWAMPIDKGGHLHIRYDDVPLGATLTGHYGQPIDAVRSRRGAPVHFKVHVNDAQDLHTKVFELGEEGFQPFSVDTSRWSGQRGTVTFEIHAANQVDRYFCFTARTLAP